MTPNSVANVSLQLDSVNFRTLDIDAVGLENMLGDSVGNAELRDDSVGNNELQINSVNQNNLQTDSVGFGELQTSSVGNSTLQNGSVTSGKIGNGQVGSTQIANGSITSVKLGGGAVTEAKIAGGAVTASKIANNNVTSPKISDATRRIIVSSGLSVGFGLNKSGSTISVNSSSFASNRHIHFYSVPTRDSDGDSLAGFEFRTTTGPDGTPSSEKFKKNISNHITQDPKKLLDLEFKKYKYKRKYKAIEDNANREWMHGYILEDLADLGFDEVLQYDSSGVPNRIDYGLFSTLVLELVKVQQQEIESLQERIKTLEEK